MEIYLPTNSIDDYFDINIQDSQYPQLYNENFQQESHIYSHTHSIPQTRFWFENLVPVQKKIIYKQKKLLKPKKKYKTETKNLCKFFGSRLNTFLLSNLIGADLELLQQFGCLTLKNLRTLWLKSSIIKEACLQYFQSSQPIIDVMHSDRISNHSCAIKYIKSFIRGIQDPCSFQKLKWND